MSEGACMNEWSPGKPVLTEKDQADWPLTHRANLAEGEGCCNLTSLPTVGASASSSTMVPAERPHSDGQVR